MATPDLNRIRDNSARAVFDPRVVEYSIIHIARKREVRATLRKISITASGYVGRLPTIR